MTFQDVNKTMKDKQVDGMMKRITDAILSQCDANIRQ
jgi:phenylalanyl-tRNA synthetase beta subunit